MIVGKRVTLRPFQPEDVPTLRAWHDDADVMRYWGDRHPILPAHSFEADIAPNGRFTQFDENGYFGICDESGRLIGRIDYEGFRLPERAAELSILIGEKDAWSKGYGSEAITLLLEWLFNDRGAHRVWLEVFPENTRAQRAYEKVGFVREGTLRETWLVDGRWHDEHVYSMLRREYNARYHPERASSH
jgi:RimJ/RimL family protein N-acetyltransferase